MIDEQTMLLDILRSAQMGQKGITAVIDKAAQPELRMALKTQRKEYAYLEKEALRLAQNKEYRIQQAAPLTYSLTAAMSRGQLLTGDIDSKIAGMMIQGNTRGAIKSLKNLHAGKGVSGAVRELADRMLETEMRNIKQMEDYL